MKKFVVFILITALTSSLYAQNNNCNNPIPNQQYLQKYNQIKNKPTESARLQIAKQIIKTYCFSSAQIQEIALLFENDYDRLEFAKEAFKNTTDKENFYDVYDAFIYYSTVFRLHDYINKTNIVLKNETEDLQVNFPDLKYPNYRIYRGERKCSGVLKESLFNSFANTLNSLSTEKEKFYTSIEFITNKCLSVEQLMKIASQIKAEQPRLDFAKKALNSAYDIDNYIEMKQVFNTPKTISDFMNFLSSQSSSNANTENNTEINLDCKISKDKYQQIIKTIQNEKYNTNKLNTTKQQIKTNKCFSVLQIKEIIALFDYENSRLEIAKYSYDFVNDHTAYYRIVSEALEFESSKKRLLDYINIKEN